MRAATRLSWAIAATTVLALTATSCGGGNGTAGGSAGVVRASWGTPSTRWSPPTPTRCRAARSST